MKRMKLLFVEANTDGTVGGSYHCLLSLIKNLNRDKYEPFVLFYQENKLIEEFKRLGCKLIILKRPSPLILKNIFPFLQNSSKDISLLFYKPLRFLQKVYNFLTVFCVSTLRFRKILKTLKIDLVHLNNGPDAYNWLIASRFSHVKCVTHVRGYLEISKAGKILIRLYDAIICISNAVQEGMNSQGVKGTDKFVIVHDGIDPGNITSRRTKGASVVRSEFGIGSDDSLIGIVGNIKWWKGQEVVIKSVELLKKKYSSLKCLMIGGVSVSEDDKAYFTSLKDLIAKNGLSKDITFTGYREDVPNLIGALDVLVHASIIPEPFGLVVLEGMTLQKPVVATNFGGPSEIIEDGISGFLVPPDDPTVLAEKIDYLLTNVKLREKIGMNGAKRVRDKFLLEFNVKKIERLYHSVLNADQKECFGWEAQIRE